jgi:hypothetical protein
MADKEEALHIGLSLTGLAATYCRENELQHLLVSAKDNINIDVLMGWITGHVAKIHADEGIPLQNMASVQSNRVQLRPDEDVLTIGNTRHMVLDDSCC